MKAWKKNVTLGTLFLLATSTGQLLAGDSYGSQIVMDSSGNAVVVWETSVAGQRAVKARTFTAGSPGSWAAEQTLSETGEDSFGPTVTMNSLGHIVAIWACDDTVVGNIHLCAAKSDITTPTTWTDYGDITATDGAENVVAQRVARHDPDYKVSLNDNDDMLAVWSAYTDHTLTVRCAQGSYATGWDEPISLTP